MIRKISAVLAACMVLFLTVVGNVSAAEPDGGGAADIMEQVKRQLSAVLEEVDEETANEVFSFLKEQVQEGNLSTQEGIENARRKVWRCHQQGGCRGTGCHHGKAGGFGIFRGIHYR